MALPPAATSSSATPSLASLSPNHDLVPYEPGPWRTTRRTRCRSLISSLPVGRFKSRNDVRCRCARPLRLQHLGRGDRERRRAVSAIVVGAGMYGAYCAAKIFRRNPGKRVLLLDAGRFLVSRARAEPRRDRAERAVADLPRAAIPAWRGSWCGGFRGGATWSFPGWPTAPAASRSTGVGGARG